MKTYIAVAGQDADTCRALNWQWTSIASYIVARGTDLDDVLDRAATRLGHDDIHIHALASEP